LTGNTRLGIIQSLTLHSGAAADLRQLMVTDKFAAGKVLALLQASQA